MPDLIRFVDSISSTPTTRLDLNDESSWWVKSFTAAPPRLRRSSASNAMRDGITVGSASYDARTLTIELECRKSTQDAGATEIQKLWRELDRTNNWIQYQPQGASKPVFFRTYRSDTSGLADIAAQAAMRTITIEVLAEPFALGLKESLGPYTISNDFSGGTNPGYVDVGTVIGDVSAPIVYWDSSVHQRRAVAATHTATALAGSWFQAESMATLNDTSNPGGGPDALMTGTGTNNYLRTTFATVPTLATRVTWAPVAALRGRWRVLAFLRRNGASSSTLTVQMDAEPAVAVPALASVRLILDLGFVSFYADDPGQVGYSGLRSSTGGAGVSFQASRSGGTDTLDWDGFFLLPAGGQVDEVDWSSQMLVSAGNSMVVDSVREFVSNQIVAGDPTVGSGTMDEADASVTGGFPAVSPGAVNRLYVIPFEASGSSLKLASTTFSLAYWPRYLLVRPVST